MGSVERDDLVKGFLEICKALVNGHAAAGQRALGISGQFRTVRGGEGACQRLGEIAIVGDVAGELDFRERFTMGRSLSEVTPVSSGIWLISDHAVPSVIQYSMKLSATSLFLACGFTMKAWSTCTLSLAEPLSSMGALQSQPQSRGSS